MEQPDRLKKFVYQDGNPIQKIWDTSSLSSFLSCPRMYNWTNLQGYKSKTYGMATGFGSAVHEGLEVLDIQKFKGATKDEAVVAAIKHVLLEFGESLNLSEDKARGLTAALRAVTWRAEEFWEDLFEIATMPDGEPCLEQRFEVPFGNGEYRFSGRIDKVVQLEGKLYLCDVKTTKTTLNSNYFGNFMPNNQVFSYLWAAREVLGLDVAGFIIDAVQTGVHFTRFDRSVYNVPTDLIMEWYKDAMHTLDTSTNYFNKQYYPADFTACNNYGGCRFKEVCSASPDRRNLFLDNDFDKQPHPDLVEAYAKAV